MSRDPITAESPITATHLLRDKIKPLPIHWQLAKNPPAEQMAETSPSAREPPQGITSRRVFAFLAPSVADFSSLLLMEFSFSKMKVVRIVTTSQPSCEASRHLSMPSRDKGPSRDQTPLSLFLKPRTLKYRMVHVFVESRVGWKTLRFGKSQPFSAYNGSSHVQ